MTGGLDFSELNTVSVDLGVASERATERAGLVVRRSLFAIERDAKIIAPVDTGFLRSSIGVDVDPDGLGGQTGPAAEYGHFVEFGTSRMAPRAYMGPALDRNSGQFVDALAQLTEQTL